ncbi:hypothetical protein SS50377_20380 [Spironucleus salmonicida]|uniref:Uncharacterized protein n=1 Tax=Spironucleus salmonicida TaxID=348837 RepID=V6LQM6_9EUKA|nr:hypothetical protein SS50377_20380 [Spironucleus salmonicida]|eukprot:EST43059.1 hypothetical protein SS50377_17362 [Spironucleus salmonicida]
MSKLPTIQPVFALNNPKAVDFPIRFGYDANTTIQLAGKFLQIHDNVSNLSKFIHLDDSYKHIACIGMDPGRRFLAIMQYESSSYKAHLFSLKPLQKVAVLYVQDSLPLPKHAIGVAVSLDGKYVVFQTGAPDYFLVAWQIPPSVTEWFQNPSTNLIPISQPKCLHNFKVQREVTNLAFHKYKSDMFCIYGPGIYTMMNVSDSSIRIQSPMNVKKIINKFDCVFQDGNYSFLLAADVSEILVLKEESLVSFIPSEVALSHHCHIRTTQKTQPPYKLIRNHPENVIAKDEKIVKLLSLQQKVLILGTSKGRILVFRIDKLDDQIESAIPRQTAPCKTVNQLSITLCEVTLVLSILLPGESPIVALDANQRLSVLAQQQNGQSYVTSRFRPSKISELIKNSLRVQAAPNGLECQNLAVLSAFDSVAKLKELIRSPGNLRIQNQALYQLNQTEFSNKVNIVGAEDLDPLDSALYADPSTWPEFLFSSSSISPFTAWLQATSSILCTIDSVLVNSQQFKPYIQFQGYQTGKQFLTPATNKITAMDVSDEAGIVCYGDDSGRIKIFSIVKQAGVADFLFRMPERNKILDKIDDSEDVARTSNHSFLDAMTTQRTQLTSILNDEQSILIEPNQPKIDLPDEFDFSKRTYEITNLKLHPTGVHILASVSCNEPQFKTFTECIIVLHIVQQDVEVASVIEISEKILQIQTDETGNFFYVLTANFLLTFTFYEFKNVAKIELKQRLTFVNQVYGNLFSEKAQLSMRNNLNMLNPAAQPTHFEISENSGLAVISFSDGDIAVFNTLKNQIEFKFSLPNSQKFAVHFSILKSENLTENLKVQRQNAINSGLKIEYLLLLTTFNDGAVQILNIESSILNILQSGNLNFNSKQTQSLLLPSQLQILEWQRMQQNNGTTSDCLIEAMMQNNVIKNHSKDHVIMCGDKGYLQIFSILQSDQNSAFQIHNSNIKFMKLLRETILITVSEDNQIIISHIKFNSTNLIQKPVPKAIIAQTQVIRSSLLQQSLDLLLFELLQKLFMLKKEGQKSMEGVKKECDQQILRHFSDFQNGKKDALKQIFESKNKLNELTLQSQLMSQEHGAKLSSLQSQLENSYDEQISRLKSERDSLQKKRLQGVENQNQIEKNYILETKNLAQIEIENTGIQVQNLSAQYQSLVADQANLQQISANNLNSAQNALETDITNLRKNVEKSIQNESFQVQNLRTEHKKMEKTYNALLQQFGDAKHQLISCQNAGLEIGKNYQFQIDQKDRIQNDIFDRENAEISKKSTIFQMSGEKQDLEKLKQLLNQRVGDLKQCVAPRDDQISDLQTQIADMDQELLKDALKQKQAELVINDLTLRKQSFKAENEQISAHIVRNEQGMKDLLFDLSKFSELYCKKMGIKINQNFAKSVEALQPQNTTDKDTKDFINALKIIYGKHIDPEFALQLKAKVDVNSEILNALVGRGQIEPRGGGNSQETGVARQREYLEKSVATLQKSLDRRREQLNQAIEQARTQSSTLLSFSNLMRRENKVLQQKLRAAKLGLMKKKKDMNILEDQMFGDALTMILDEQCGEVSDVVSGSEEDFQDVALDSFLDKNYPVGEKSDRDRSALPPGVPRPPSKLGKE